MDSFVIGPLSKSMEPESFVAEIFDQSTREVFETSWKEAKQRREETDAAVNASYSDPDFERVGEWRALVGSPQRQKELEEEARRRTELSKAEEDFKASLSEDWDHITDEGFAFGFVMRFRQPEVQPKLPASSNLCEACSTFSKTFTRLASPSELVTTSVSCSLCKVFLRCLQNSGVSDDCRITILKEASTLQMHGFGQNVDYRSFYPDEHKKSDSQSRIISKRNFNQIDHRTETENNGRTILRICVGMESPMARKIQTEFPVAMEPNSHKFFELLRAWIRECDENHACRFRPRDHIQSKPLPRTHGYNLKPIRTGHKQIGPRFRVGLTRRPSPHGHGFRYPVNLNDYDTEDGPLPTRVIDVGGSANPDSLSLYCTKRDETGRYIALSHRWGEVGSGDFCTYRCNIDTRSASMDLKELPKTFQDAVTVTRELGIQFLWIDSICIVQPHNGCDKCRDGSDWDIECQKMDIYFSSAYCTIAATSAKDSTESFLKSRSERMWAKISGTSEGSLYVTDVFDDFHRDVEEAELNKRGWVLQERALSRRIIHFTSTQAYWECGCGVRCETLSKIIRNSRANFLGDPQFPRSILSHFERNRVRLFQHLFELYSGCRVSIVTDRSVAISGLENRLARTFDSEVQYGIFRRYLHRSLLWQRADEKRMKRISYPNDRKVPSWSWMAYNGEIKYMDVPFQKIKWNASLQCASWKSGDNSTVLNAISRRFQWHPITAGRSELIFDEEDDPSPSFTSMFQYIVFQCIVIGVEEGEEAFGDIPYHRAVTHYYILIIRPKSPEDSCRIYERIGVGVIGADLLIEGGEFEVQIC